jgi:hypothetical protein
VRRVDVESSAEPFDVLKVELLVCLLRSLPILLLPNGLTKADVAEAAHESLAHGIQLTEGGFPHLKDVDRWGYDMPNLIVTVEGVDDSKPSIFALLGYVEQLSIVASVRRRSQLFNVLNGYCSRVRIIKSQYQNKNTH